MKNSFRNKTSEARTGATTKKGRNDRARRDKNSDIFIDSRTQAFLSSPVSSLEPPTDASPLKVLTPHHQFNELIAYPSPSLFLFIFTALFVNLPHRSLILLPVVSLPFLPPSPFFLHLYPIFLTSSTPSISLSPFPFHFLFLFFFSYFIIIPALPLFLIPSILTHPSSTFSSTLPSPFHSLALPSFLLSLH